MHLNLYINCDANSILMKYYTVISYVLNYTKTIYTIIIASNSNNNNNNNHNNNDDNDNIIICMS